MASYDWWHRALAGWPLGGPDMPVHEDKPELGFYRRRMKARDGTYGPWLPVAIYEKGPHIFCMVNGRQAKWEDHWLFCCGNPITEEAYLHAVKTGEWKDVDATPRETEKPESPDDFQRMIEACKDGIELYAEITDDEQAQRAQSLRSRFLSFARDADKLRTAEKKPHFDAAKAVDLVWQPIIQTAKASADRIRNALSKYETAKAKAAREQRVNEPLPERIIPGEGRTATVKTIKVIAEITDRNALYHWLFKTYPDAHTFMERLAAQAVANGDEVPGVRIEEERKVR